MQIDINIIKLLSIYFLYKKYKLFYILINKLKI